MSATPPVINLRPVNIDPDELERYALLDEIVRVQDEIIKIHLELRRLTSVNEKLKKRARELGAKIWWTQDLPELRNIRPDHLNRAQI